MKKSTNMEKLRNIKIEQKINQLIDKGKLLGIISELPTYCNHICYIIHKTPMDHILIIPSDVTELTQLDGNIDFNTLLMLLRGNLKVIGGINLKHTYNLFAYCAFDSLDLSELITSKVTTMKSMFMRSSIPSIDLSMLDTHKVKDISQMFFSCNTCKINLNNMVTTDKTKMNNIFSYITYSLETTDNRIQAEYNRMLRSSVYTPT